MKKILLGFFFALIGNFTSAQLDTEHWFAAMYDGQSNSNSFEYLHLSTDSKEPFIVSVYSGNTLIAESTISLGSPQFISIDREYIITRNAYDLFSPIDKGLHVIGNKRFFANLRFGVTNHAEIITSKGQAGLGNEFFTVMAPNQQDSNIGQGFTTSIIATEDNTTITIPKFNKDLLFTDGVQRNSITFTLNKGQTYIVDGRSLTVNNLDGFIGTKIISDKPISITNGNFNGQYISGTNPESGSDILMDQSVPTDKLGNEFGIIKGYGRISSDGNGMERAIIVATKNQTKIYINSSSTPITTLNEGEYYFVPDSFYIRHGYNHYNLHIKTTENVYVYQVLGGVEWSDSAIATGGMNYIPPLNCYLPRKIEEIGHINSIGDSPRTAKLNIISEKGAKILINGEPIDPYYGPFPLANNSWETYSVYHFSGNITIQSNKAITAGIAAGDGGAEGYGGYFAGFSNIPLISKKSGECLPDVILELPEGYDMYIWEKKNEDGTYTKISEGSHLFKPTEIGYYRARIQQGTCEPVTTKDFRLLNCVTYTSKSISICKSETFTTQLSLSNSIIDGESIQLMKQPNNGKVLIDKINNTITYISNDTAVKEDFLIYTICGKKPSTECEEIQLKINLNSIPLEISKIQGCLLENGNISYDLSKINLTKNPSEYSKYFYKTKNDAENNINEITTNLSNYITSQATIFIKVISTKGCEEIIEIPLEHYPLPELTTNTYSICDLKFEGKVDFNLNDLSKILVKNIQYFPIIKYYNNQADAIKNGPSIATNTISITGKTIVYIAIETPNGCETKIYPITLDIANKVNLKSAKETIEICDDDLDGIKKITDLQQFKNLFTTSNNVKLAFFTSKTNAIQNSNEITGHEFNANGNTVFIKFTEDGVCPNIAELTIKIKAPKKSTILKDQTICAGATTVLNAGIGFDYYKWSSGEEGASKHEIRISKGEYWVDLTYNGCVYRQYIKVDNFEEPSITSIEVKGNEAIIQVEGGNQPYQYSLDGIQWQSSNVFSNITRGIHTAYVKGNDGCNVQAKEFLIINLVNVITPNGDGFNDILDYSDLRIKKDVSIQIFNRHGILVYQSQGLNYLWDGTISGRKVQSDSYWYVLKWIEPDTNLPVIYSNWILVKNRN